MAERAFLVWCAGQADASRVQSQIVGWACVTHAFDQFHLSLYCNLSAQLRPNCLCEKKKNTWPNVI